MRNKTLYTIVVVIGIIILIFLLGGAARFSRRAREAQASAITGGKPQAAPDKIRKYGCNSCHTIPGVDGANGLVGPPLTNIGSRAYIAGELPNTPENLMRWIQHPHAVEQHTVMPEMGVTEEDSKDIAAYLYTLR